MTVVSQLCDRSANVVDNSKGYWRGQHVDLVCEVGESSSGVDPSQSVVPGKCTRARALNCWHAS